MDDDENSSLKYEFNTDIDVERLRDVFKERKRIRVENVLTGRVAEAMYHRLSNGTPWRTFVVANQTLMGTPPGSVIGPGRDDEEILTTAYDGASNGFAVLYDADRLFPEDRQGEEDNFARDDVSTLPWVTEMAKSDRFRRLITGLTDLNEGASIEVQSMRLRCGHFVGFQSALMSSSKNGRHTASFLLHLTPDWKVEWGGLLSFRSSAGIAEGFIPCFNTLDVFAFPLGHWITAVAPFAAGPMMAIVGRVYRA
jgi:SM-20-related protein